MTKLALAAAAFSLALGGAALAQDPAPAAAPAPAVEAAPASAAPVAEPPAAAPAPAAVPAATAGAEAMGRIYFFRPARLPGAIQTPNVIEVGDDGDQSKESPVVGALPNGRGFVVEVTPGIHNYNMRGGLGVSKDEDRLRMEVEPGETYYVEQTIRIGVVTGGYKLVPADEARFKAAKIKLKP